MELFSPKKLLRALLCSYLLSGILLLITAFVLYKFRLKESQIQLAIAVIYVLSGAVAGFLFAKAAGKRRFFCGLAAGLSYFLILAMASSFSGKGLSISLSHLLLTMAMCVFGGILGAILS